MKLKMVLMAGLALALALSFSVAAAGPGGGPELAQLRAATARYHRTEVAMADGYNFVDGLDHCFFSPGEGGMGYHLINAGLLDTTVEALRPEALVYQPGPNGQLKLGAVEYIVPAAAWDAEGHGDLPQVLGQTLHLNAPLGVYVLHAWIFDHNPAGIFEDWNPKVTCSG
jgi:hypothetical protein